MLKFKCWWEKFPKTILERFYKKDLGLVDSISFLQKKMNTTK